MHLQDLTGGELTYWTIARAGAVTRVHDPGGSELLVGEARQRRGLARIPSRQVRHQVGLA